MKKLIMIVSLVSLTGCLGGLREQMKEQAKMENIRECQKTVVKEPQDGGGEKITETYRCNEYRRKKF
jgi:hypothetical protein